MERREDYWFRTLDPVEFQRWKLILTACDIQYKTGFDEENKMYILHFRIEQRRLPFEFVQMIRDEILL